MATISQPGHSVRTRRAWAVAVLVILSGIPVALWAAYGRDLALRFGDMEAAFRSLGQLAGISGLTLFAINLILSARIALIDRMFAGLDFAYRTHHIIGGLSFVFLLAHPLLLAARLLSVSLGDAFALFLPGIDLANTFGQIALLGLMLLLVLTYYVSLRYETWRWSHRFLGVVFLFGLFHAFLAQSDLSSNEPLKWYVLLLSAFAVVSYGYRSVFGRWLVARRSYVLTSLRPLGTQITELHLSPVREPITFQPGQFAFVSFRVAGRLGETHPFTISSAPTSGEVVFSIKALGDYTNALPSLRPGIRAVLEGPYGNLTLHSAKTKRLVWVAGGIGITPFLSMARGLSLVSGYEIDWYHTVKTAPEAIFADELKSLSIGQNVLRFHQVVSERDGVLTAERIRQQHDLQQVEVFLCGPRSMMRALRSQLKQLGFPSSRIHSEEFSLLTQ